MPIEIQTEEDFKELIANTDKLMIVDFHATWCGPCQAMKPVFAKVEKNFPSVKFVSVDVDKAQSVAQRYFIKSIPVLLLFKFGEIRGGVVGGQSETQIAELLNNELDPKKPDSPNVASEPQG